ncbi:hypothetical protein BV25DRAFT_527195 [Artomyces pyxidatus]|uniref:Uncharacterized protein n=1 Tax=Artomyces pyxidatus TaxID=48021 RepID=A0ACB8TI90_9AGAM|nr:hypothetical protein BV25DRAFT_527195 [Artomyces pyxidatus]
MSRRCPPHVGHEPHQEPLSPLLALLHSIVHVAWTQPRSNRGCRMWSILEIPPRSGDGGNIFKARQAQRPLIPPTWYFRPASTPCLDPFDMSDPVHHNHMPRQSSQYRAISESTHNSYATHQYEQRGPQTHKKVASRSRRMTAATPPAPPLTPEWEEASRMRSRPNDSHAWAEAEKAFLYRQRAQQRKVQADPGMRRPSLGSTSAYSTSSSMRSSSYITAVSTPTEVHFPSYYSGESEEQLERDVSMVAVERGGIEGYDFCGPRYVQYEEDGMRTPPRASRSKSSRLMSSLSLGLSQRSYDAPSLKESELSPTRRLAPLSPLSRYNPFVRARSESLSSVMEERHGETLHAQGANRRRGSTCLQ